MGRPSRDPSPDGAASEASNTFVQYARKIYRPLGFRKGYNFVLWFLCLGYIFGFAMARIMYLDYYGIFCSRVPRKDKKGAAPGECFYYLRNPWKTGMQLHLYCIFPAAILVCLQFTPWARYKSMLLHRLNGYIVIALSLISSAGILMIAGVAFGGDFGARTWSGAMVILTTSCYIMAYINIKLLQIDQHRAWMIRCWALFSTIVTLRLIMLASAHIISSIGGFATIRPCAQIASVMGQPRTLTYYPVCSAYFDGSSPSALAIVTANFYSHNPMEIAAAYSVPFGTAGWLSLVIHSLAAEIYLRLTPVEGDRLRRVSYERQLQAGLKRPGYAGLTAERLGDVSSPFTSTTTYRQDRHEDAKRALEPTKSPNAV